MGGVGGSYLAICWLFYVQVLFIRHSSPRLYPLTKSVGHQTSFLSCPSTYDAHKNIRWSKQGGASWGFASHTALSCCSAAARTNIAHTHTHERTQYVTHHARMAHGTTPWCLVAIARSSAELNVCLLVQSSTPFVPCPG
jgi:hypothetical protein